MTLTYTDLLGSDVHYGRTIRRHKHTAYCYSSRCNSPSWKTTTARKEIPEAKRGDIDCPRCGHALCFEAEEK